MSTGLTSSQATGKQTPKQLWFQSPTRILCPELRKCPAQGPNVKRLSQIATTDAVFCRSLVPSAFH